MLVEDSSVKNCAVTSWKWQNSSAHHLVSVISFSSWVCACLKMLCQVPHCVGECVGRQRKLPQLAKVTSKCFQSWSGPYLCWGMLSSISLYAVFWARPFCLACELDYSLCLAWESMSNGRVVGYCSILYMHGQPLNKISAELYRNDDFWTTTSKCCQAK